jgi:hypothetical protein
MEATPYRGIHAYVSPYACLFPPPPFIPFVMKDDASRLGSRDTPRPACVLGASGPSRSGGAPQQGGDVPAWLPLHTLGQPGLGA